MSRKKTTPSAGKLILAWRTKKKLTLRELAERSGVYKSSLQRMEAGAQDPKASDVAAIASALKITLPEFYSLEGA